MLVPLDVMMSKPHRRPYSPRVAQLVGLLLGVLLALCGSACGDVREVSGVYTERLHTIDGDTRRYVLRMTIFEYDGLVGGWAEYYELNEINHADAPYVQPYACAYFGPLRRADELTVINVRSPEEGERVLLRMEPDGRKILHAQVTRAGGLVEDGEALRDITFEKRSDRPAESCPQEAILLDQAQHLPAHRDTKVVRAKEAP